MSTVDEQAEVLTVGPDDEVYRAPDIQDLPWAIDEHFEEFSGDDLTDRHPIYIRAYWICKPVKSISVFHVGETHLYEVAEHIVNVHNDSLPAEVWA